MSKTFVAGAVAAAALAVGGGAVAATQFGSDADEQAILNDAATRLGVDPNELSAALEGAFAARIDAAVAAGDLTQEQADRMKQRLADGNLPLFGGGHGPHGPMFGGAGLDAAATFLGLTDAELRQALASGQTLAEVAGEQGKTVEGLKQAMVDAATADLEQAVADGKLTEEQQQQILGNLPERIDAIIQGELPARGPGRGMHGPEEDLPDASAETT